jgi:hypothetical protein
MQMLKNHKWISRPEHVGALDIFSFSIFQKIWAKPRKQMIQNAAEDLSLGSALRLARPKALRTNEKPFPTDQRFEPNFPAKSNSWGYQRDITGTSIYG